MKPILCIAAVLLSFFADANPPCPCTPRHVPVNGIYTELGGGSRYAGMGYSLALNLSSCATFHYLALNLGYAAGPRFIDSDNPKGLLTSAEFHKAFSENSKILWSLGLSYARLHSLNNTDPPGDRVRKNYLHPMAGLEFLFDNSFAIDVKFQPYTDWETVFNYKNFNPYAGVKLKFMIGERAYGNYVGYY